MYSDCVPTPGREGFTICTFNANVDNNVYDVQDVFTAYLSSKAHHVGTSILNSTKVVRNQFQLVMNCTRNHQFGYVVFGELEIVQEGVCTFCAR